ncbi:MAG: hypothetical protein WCD42_09755, partial [Rhizomicrobium sp.]
MTRGTHLSELRPGNWHSGIWECLIVTALFGLITVAFFWPWIAHISSHLPGPAEDNLLEYW